MATRLKTYPIAPQDGDYTLTRETANDFVTAANQYGVDPCWLLGLLMTESGNVNRYYAERWGGVGIFEVRQMIDNVVTRLGGAKPVLQQTINQAWPDISFGRSQAIVAYHPEFLKLTPEERYTPESLPDHNGVDAASAIGTVEAVLAVRLWCFNNPTDDLRLAAKKFSEKLLQTGGDVLGACVAYNAGSDRRGDARWMERYSSHVERYTENLAVAERYRDEGPDTVQAAAALGGLWGIANLMEPLAPEYARQQRIFVQSVKAVLNELLPEGSKVP